MIFRPYQDNAIRDIDIFMKSDLQSGIIVAPVGAGKSLIIAHIPNTYKFNTLVLQPSKELLEQNLEKYLSYGNKASVYSASMHSKEVGAVTFATPRSIKGKAHLFNVDVIVIDECHLGGKDYSVIHTLIYELKPKKVIGFTANPLVTIKTIKGSIMKMIHQHSPIFKSVIHITQVQEVEPYWARIVYKKSRIDDSVLVENSTGNDFTDESIEKFTALNHLDQKIVQAVEYSFITLKSTNCLIFAPNLKYAAKLGHILKAPVISSDMKRDKVSRIIKEFKEGLHSTIINVGILTTGFDFPALTSIINARPIGSFNLFYQVVGRGVRQFNDKTFHYIDLANNLERFPKLHHIHFTETDMYLEGKKVTNVFKPHISIKRVKPELIVPFGKYKGQTIYQVAAKDPLYLRWVSKQFEGHDNETKHFKTELTKLINI